MPPLIFDFPAIASRLRKDDFFTPAPKAEPVCTGVDLAEVGSDRTVIHCPHCNYNNVEKSVIHSKGKWWCIPCQRWFS